MTNEKFQMSNKFPMTNLNCLVYWALVICDLFGICHSTFAIKLQDWN